MKRFETPILNVEKFDLVNIITASGDVQVTPEPKANAVELATADVANTKQIFTITL